MSKPRQKHAWVTRTDITPWAMTYLERRCIKTPDSPPAKEIFERLSLIHTIKWSTDENISLLKGMKAAWRKQKSRDNQTDKKPHNFVLSETAGRQLHRLSGDFRETQTRTLEIIIADSLARENSAKADRKDEVVFKKRAAILERELSQALNELHEYELRLSQAGVDIASPLDTKQQKTVKSLSRARKNEVISQLPALPACTPKKTKKPATTTKKASIKRSQAGKPAVVSESPAINANQIKEPYVLERYDETLESQKDSFDISLSEAAAGTDPDPDPTPSITPAPAAAEAMQKSQEALTTETAIDPITTTPAITQASSAHFNEHHDDDAQQQIPPDASSETDPEPVIDKTANLGVSITAQKPPEPPATELNDDETMTGSGAPIYSMHDEQPECEQLNEVGNRSDFTEEDMAELKRLLHDSES
jgi:hypothetical protein